MSSDSFSEIKNLRAAPWRYSFVDAVAELEAARPGSAPIGHLGPVAKEAVRLRPVLDFAFPNADIESLTALGDDSENGPWRLNVTFMGLYGQASPLPTYLTESLFVDDPNPGRDFIDIFNHRLLSFAYRAMCKYRLTRRPELLQAATRLMGVGPEDQAGGRLRAFIGLLSQQPRSAGALGSVLSAAFGGVPVEVEQCVPRWTSLPGDRLARLGEDNCTIGGDCILGQRIFTRTSTFAIAIGPVDNEVFRGFLPGGGALATVAELVNEFNVEHLDYEIEVAVHGDALAPVTLDGQARLGWDSRLEGPPPDHYHIRITAAA